MKVKELIENLSKLDPDLDVYRPGYEGGYEDIDSVIVVDIIRNYYSKKEWWNGPHELLDTYTILYNEGTRDQYCVSIPGLILR